jgi:hypothetical protein
MRGVRRISERINDPNVEIPQGLEGAFGQVHNVTRIGETTESITEAADETVILIEGHCGNWAGGPLNREELAVAGDRVTDGDPWVKPPSPENIVKAPAERPRRLFIGPTANLLSLAKRECANVVYAVALIGVIVGEKEPVQSAHFRRDHLLAKLWGGVNNDGRLRVGAVAPESAHQQGAA